MITYSDNAAFWVFNRVAHFKYLFYNRVIGDIQKVQKELEMEYQVRVKDIDRQAIELLSKSKEEAVTFLTEFSSQSGQNTVRSWKELDNFLLVKYLDSNIKQEENGRFIDNGHGYPAKPKQVGYPDTWKKHVVEENGAQFKAR